MQPHPRSDRADPERPARLAGGEAVERDQLENRLLALRAQPRLPVARARGRPAVDPLVQRGEAVLVAELATANPRRRTQLFRVPPPLAGDDVAGDPEQQATGSPRLRRYEPADSITATNTSAV